MPHAYRIVRWRELYECTDKGRGATAQTPDSELMRGPFSYVRWRVGGRDDSPGVKRLKAACGSAARYMDARALFSVLVEIAGQNRPGLRGWIVNAEGRPYNGEEIALVVGFPVSRTAVALRCLCDPAVRWLQQVEYPAALCPAESHAGDSREFPENQEKQEKCGKFPQDSPESPKSGNPREVPANPSHDRPSASANMEHEETEPEHGEGGVGGGARPGDKSGDQSGEGSGSFFSTSSRSRSPDGEPARMPVGVLSGSGREPYRRGEPVGLGQLLTAAPGLLGGPEIADASEIGTNLAVAIDLRAPPGFDAAQTARTPEERQFKADVVCLVRLGAHIACGRMGRPGEAIRRTEKKCRDLARSPSARTIGSRMRILLSWAKDELRRHGHHW